MILVEGPILTDKITEIIQNNNDHQMGAHAIFLGQVRADEFDGHKVVEIEYSAYEDMVTIEAEKIKKHIFSKYDQVSCIEIYHSAGIVKAGEYSLYVFVSAGHRKQAFDASEETVEMIKDNFPVWKKELLDNGEYIWTENKK